MRASPVSRAASLLEVLRRDPGEFLDRLSAIVAGRTEPLRHRPPGYTACDWDSFVGALPAEVREPFAAALREPGPVALEAEVDAAARAHAAAPIDSLHNADRLLARCCYGFVRAVRPATVVETGVAHGVTTAFILAALDANGRGVLHSIDLPPHERGAERHTGAFVPARLRARWTLHRGLAARVLPALLDELTEIDMFVHDSLHTYRNMSFEFSAVWPRLRAGGIIVADDIEGNRAFRELQARAPRFHGVCVQASKPALFGAVIR